MDIVKTGLENFIENPPKWVFGKRIGLLSNAASVDKQFRHARELINQKFPGQLTALYSPQHGFYAEKQDNMIESNDMVDPLLQIPVFSLYGRTRIPDKKMLDPIDILMIDLQDVGTRVYTFTSTMSLCLEASKAYGKKVFVLDRPNPIGGTRIEGNCLSPEYASFVGRYPIPMRHGLTIGELSLLFNNYYKTGCLLEVIPMKGWERTMYFHDTGLPWIPPSPNLPTLASALTYPGQVLWEGTNVSEGRGTCLPFEQFGAPFFDTKQILSNLDKNKTAGTILRETAFEPTSNKWKDTRCKGFQIHITDLNKYKPYQTSFHLLQTIISLYKDRFDWKPRPYEYEFDRRPIDLIIGDKGIRQRLEDLDEIDAIEESWEGGLHEFINISREFRLYT